MDDLPIIHFALKHTLKPYKDSLDCNKCATQCLQSEPVFILAPDFSGEKKKVCFRLLVLVHYTFTLGFYKETKRGKHEVV